MGTAKRERQKQGRMERLEEARLAQAKSQRQRSVRFAIGGVVLLLVLAFVLSRTLVGDDDRTTSTAGGDTSSTVAGDTSTTLAGGQVQITIPPAGATVSGDTKCPEADGSSERTTKFEKAPPTCIDASKTYKATIETNKGSFTVELDAKAAPLAVNNFVTLARYHYYDGVAYHRIITDFVNQAGDAVGPTPGSGGPGYSFADELPASKDVYTQGAFAMANSGPNTNGSQFFVVAAPDRLEALYTKFGQVTDGLDVVLAINKLATANPQGALPTTTDLVTITSVTIDES